MKLQYKNNQWEGENGIPIAPNDQEKVSYRICPCHNCRPSECNHKFDPSKLYDSGDLEFELDWEECPVGCDSVQDCVAGHDENQKCLRKQFWVLKDKAKEEPSETKEIENIEYLIWHGVARTCEEKCHCHAECNKADDFIANFKSKFRIIRIKESN